ncbi:acid protease [Mollisia scopiformis]|uniref:Acid protease n=1 Tax=Mollisia scopiformis TaxID=149040 RepID=A0A194XBN5_MOLSC|nr:acid protease [Mollisia scopiformis]KUJ17177.1 acid protease [Mollisia scopiformis]
MILSLALPLLVAQRALGQGGPRQGVAEQKSVISMRSLMYGELLDDAKSQISEGKTVVTATGGSGPFAHTTIVTATPGWDENWGPEGVYHAVLDVRGHQHIQVDGGEKVAIETSPSWASTATVTGISGWEPEHHCATPTMASAVGKRYWSGHEAEKEEEQFVNKLPHFNASAMRHDTRWVTSVYLGNPPILLQVEINTGSSDFWVYPEGKGWAMPGYNASNSTTHVLHDKQTFKSVDQGGTVSGTVVEDAMRFGVEAPDADPSPDNAYGQLLSNNCTFGVVSKQNHASAITLPDETTWNSLVSPDNTQAYVDGMLGLGMAKLDDKSPTKFLPWLARTHNITLFTLSLEGGRSSERGYFGLGYIDKKRVNGTISYTPAQRTPYRKFGPGWGITMTSFEVIEAQQPPTETNVQVVVDSGTEYIYLPKDLVNQYYRQVEGATYNTTYKQWFLPCEGGQMPEISFGLKGGYVGTLSRVVLEDHIPIWGLATASGPEEPELTVCAGRLQEVEKGGQAIFGWPFFSSRFLVFDLHGEKIGIAKQKKPRNPWGYYDDDEE